MAYTKFTEAKEYFTELSKMGNKFAEETMKNYNNLDSDIMAGYYIISLYEHCLEKMEKQGEH